MSSEVKTTEPEDSILVPITLNIDIGAKSSMFCCTVCLELIQAATSHRQCNLCGNTICTGCIAELRNRGECPTCRKRAIFVSNSLIHKDIYPIVSKKCTWPKCNKMLFNIDSHMRSCVHRIVKCPVCHFGTPIQNIHDHLRDSCDIRMGRPKDAAAEFSNEIIAIGKLPANEIYCRIFNLNPSGIKDNSGNTRLLYFWRKTNPRRGFIRMMCIQLCASEDEEIVYAQDTRGCAKKLKIANLNNFESIEPTIEYADNIANYTNIGIPAGIHMLTYGEKYEISRNIPDDPEIRNFMSILQLNNRPFKGNLIEVLWGPPRGVFVDSSGNIITLLIDTAVMNRIKKISNTATPRTDSGSFRYPGSFVTIPGSWFGSQNSEINPSTQRTSREVGATMGHESMSMWLNRRMYSYEGENNISEHDSSSEDDIPSIESIFNRPRRNAPTPSPIPVRPTSTPESAQLPPLSSEDTELNNIFMRAIMNAMLRRSMRSGEQ